MRYPFLCRNAPLPPGCIPRGKPGSTALVPHSPAHIAAIPDHLESADTYRSHKYDFTDSCANPLQVLPGIALRRFRDSDWIPLRLPDGKQGSWISEREARYLLSFCNNTSPMFIVSYIIWQNLKVPALTLPLLVILTAAPVMLSFVFRRLYQIPKQGETGNRKFFLQSPGFGNGSGNGSGSLDTRNMQIMQALALTSFGGWCAAAQTRAMIQGTSLPFLPYIAEKLITALATSLLVWLFLYL